LRATRTQDDHGRTLFFGSDHGQRSYLGHDLIAVDNRHHGSCHDDNVREADDDYHSTFDYYDDVSQQ
jgi:hypothetical protein